MYFVRFSPIIALFLYILMYSSCSNNEKTPRAIFRNKNDIRVPRNAEEAKAVANQREDRLPNKRCEAPVYPWDEQMFTLNSITKEYFRCKGSSLNPPHIIYENGKEKDRIWDCGGIERHGLPVRNNQEFIYPALLEILNFVQSSLEKPIIITSGHRCPSHEQYIDIKQKNVSSKHLIGGAASFFVQGFESQPDKVIQEVQKYYLSNPLFASKKEYIEFTRSETSDTQTSAWSNKEIFIKLYLPHEGRNLDNRHPFAYVDIQVRFDRSLNKPVTFTWQEAQTYLRK